MSANNGRILKPRIIVGDCIEQMNAMPERRIANPHPEPAVADVSGQQELSL